MNPLKERRESTSSSTEGSLQLRAGNSQNHKPLERSLERSVEKPRVTTSSKQRSTPPVKVLASADPNNPSFVSYTQSYFNETLGFNSTNSTYYYLIDSVLSIDDYHTYLGFYLKMTSSLDVDLTLRVENQYGEIIGKSWNQGAGKDELLVIAPTLYTQLRTKPIFVSLTRINGEGLAEFYYRKIDETEVVGKNASYYEGKARLQAFDMLAFNYSAGENLTLLLYNTNQVSDTGRNVYDVYVFALNGNASSAFKTWTNVTVNFLDVWPFGSVVEYDVGIIPRIEFDGALVVIIGKEFPQNTSYISGGSKVEIPTINGAVPTRIPRNTDFQVQVNALEPSVFYFEVGLDPEVYTISIYSPDGEFEHALSQDPFFTQEYTYTYSSNGENLAYYVIRKMNKDYHYPPGQSVYFLKIKGSLMNQNIIVRVQVGNNYWNVNDGSYTFTDTVTQGQVLTKIFYVDGVSSEKVVWVEPANEVNVEIAWFNSTGGKTDARWADNNGKGGIETLGKFKVNLEKTHVLVIIGKEGSGTVKLSFEGSDDVIPPLINSVTFASLNISNLDTLSYSVDATDNLAVYNSTIEYRAIGSQGEWKRFTSVGPSEALPVYGTWSLRVLVFDVSGNVAIDDNNSNYYTLVVRDEKPPDIGQITLSLNPRTDISLSVEVSDPDSGVKTVIIEYSYLIKELTGNITASLINGKYRVTLPPADYGETITITVFAVDLDGNWNVEQQTYAVEEKTVNFAVNSPSKVEPKSSISIEVSIYSNVEVEIVWMQYVYGDETRNLTAVEANDTTYVFVMTLNDTGVLEYWFLARTTEGDIFRSQNYTITIENAIGTGTNTDSSPADEGGSSPNNQTIPETPKSRPLDKMGVVALVIGTTALISATTIYFFRDNLQDVIKKIKRQG